MPIPLIATVISGEEQYSYDAHKLNSSLLLPATSFHLTPDIPVSTLFSNNFSLHSLFREGDQAMLFICLWLPECGNIHDNDIFNIAFNM
jgi:hypothetical protein